MFWSESITCLVWADSAVIMLSVNREAVLVVMTAKSVRPPALAVNSSPASPNINVGNT